MRCSRTVLAAPPRGQHAQGHVSTQHHGFPRLCLSLLAPEPPARSGVGPLVICARVAAKHAPPHSREGAAGLAALPRSAMPEPRPRRVSTAKAGRILASDTGTEGRVGRFDGRPRGRCQAPLDHHQLLVVLVACRSCRGKQRSILRRSDGGRGGRRGERRGLAVRHADAPRRGGCFARGHSCGRGLCVASGELVAELNDPLLRFGHLRRDGHSVRDVGVLHQAVRHEAGEAAAVPGLGERGVRAGERESVLGALHAGAAGDHGAGDAAASREPADELGEDCEEKDRERGHGEAEHVGLLQPLDQLPQRAAAGRRSRRHVAKDTHVCRHRRENCRCRHGISREAEVEEDGPRDPGCQRPAEVHVVVGRDAVEAEQQPLVHVEGEQHAKEGDRHEEGQHSPEQQGDEHALHDGGVARVQVELWPLEPAVQLALGDGALAGVAEALEGAATLVAESPLHGQHVEEAKDGRHVRHKDVDEHGEGDLHADGGIPDRDQVLELVPRQDETGDAGVDEQREDTSVDHREKEEALGERLCLRVEAVVGLPLRHVLEKDPKHAVDDWDDGSGRNGGNGCDEDAGSPVGAEASLLCKRHCVVLA
mmetsp:Transcript_6185/g.25767  ORF Transcript_6185/g.25767 Transcript_6185/m.25767 type:complete len:594 (+) Transcript_6185:594-2375(+)